MRNSLAFGFLAIVFWPANTSGGGGGARRRHGGAGCRRDRSTAARARLPDQDARDHDHARAGDHVLLLLQDAEHRDDGVKKWSSEMTPGSHHMIMFTTAHDSASPRAPSRASECGVGGASAQNVADLDVRARRTPTRAPLPADDGTGKPLGAGHRRRHSRRTSRCTTSTRRDSPISSVHVTLNAEAFEAGAAYTRTVAVRHVQRQYQHPARRERRGRDARPAARPPVRSSG